MEVPKEVLKAAAGLVEMYGPKLAFLGEKEGAKYYVFRIPESETTGFPFVYSFKDGLAVEITGLEAVDVLRLFGVE